MSEPKEVYEWFDGMGYDTRAVSLVRVAKDAWSESNRRATAAERGRWIAAVNRVNPRYALAILHDALPQETQ